jgi:hypothetical protein
MKMIFKLRNLLFLAFIAFLLGSCKKGDVISIPLEVATFAGLSAGSYFILSPTTTFKVPIGLTTVENKDRQVTVTVTSPTGAVAGTHYTLSGTTVTIPAGQTKAEITVNGSFNLYNTGRKDTLIFTIQDPTGSNRSEGFNNVFKLFVSGPCFEGDVTLSAFLGTYAKTNEDFGGSTYGPYTTTITSATPLTATTAMITVTNIYDFGWGPITFKLDWTNASNRIVSVEPSPQENTGDAGTLSGTYAGQKVWIRNHSNGQLGTFSACNGTLTLVMQTGVVNVGFFGAVYIVTMAR